MTSRELFGLIGLAPFDAISSKRVLYSPSLLFYQISLFFARFRVKSMKNPLIQKDLLESCLSFWFGIKIKASTGVDLTRSVIGWLMLMP